MTAESDMQNYKMEKMSDVRPDWLHWLMQRLQGCDDDTQLSEHIWSRGGVAAPSDSTCHVCQQQIETSLFLTYLTFKGTEEHQVEDDAYGHI